MSGCEDVWGQLFSGQENNCYLISKKQFIIGKAKDCDLHLESHLISDKHCYLLRDDNGQVWLYDTSSSGTLLNQRQKSKEKAHYEKETKWITNGDYGKIEDGDEFVLCHNEHPTSSLNFTFYKVDNNCCESDIMVGCRESDSASDSSRSRKREASDEKCDDSSRSRRLESVQDQCGDRAKKTKTSENSNVDKSNPTTSSSSSSESSSSDKTNNCKDKMEDALTCSICQDIFHDCISVQPCMHSFCGGCYAPWMKKSSSCPTCRLKVLRISKNHIVNNLVDAFLCQCPNKRRSDADLKELDSRNTITQDMLYPKREQNVEDAEGNENYPMILVGGVWTHIPDINYRFPTQNELDELWREQHLPGYGGESSDAESDGWWRDNGHSSSGLIEDSDYVPSTSPDSYTSVQSDDLVASENFSNPARSPPLSENSWSTAEDDSHSLLPVAEDSDNDSTAGGSENRLVRTLSENSWASAEYESNAPDSFSEQDSDSDNESAKVESGSEDFNNSEVNENCLSEASDNEDKEENATSANSDASNSDYESL